MRACRTGTSVGTRDESWAASTSTGSGRSAAGSHSAAALRGTVLRSDRPRAINSRSGRVRVHQGTAPRFSGPRREPGRWWAQRFGPRTVPGMKIGIPYEPFHPVHRGRRGTRSPARRTIGPIGAPWSRCLPEAQPHSGMVTEATDRIRRRRHPKWRDSVCLRLRPGCDQDVEDGCRAATCHYGDLTRVVGGALSPPPGRAAGCRR